jgi:cobalt/nickel transport system permease protein
MAEQSFMQRGQHRHRGHFFETVAAGLTQAMDHALDAEAVAARSGLLQGLDPRFKLIALLTLILAVLLVTSLTALAVLFFLAIGLALSSYVSLARLLKQIWISVLLFTGIIALPALLLVPGDPVFELPLVHWPVTLQGLRSAAFLIGRAETASTFALLLILTTPWPHVLKALRAIRVPVIAVAVLGMTYRYIFVLIQTAIHMLEGRRARVVGPTTGAERRRMIAGSGGVLLGKAFALSGEVYLAMLSRGYHGEVYLLDDFRAKPRDWAALVAAMTVPALILWVQR